MRSSGRGAHVMSVIASTAARKRTSTEVRDRPLADIPPNVQTRPSPSGCQPMNVRPDLQVAPATAQSIIDNVAPGHTVTAVVNLHGGEIAAVYEIKLAERLH